MKGGKENENLPLEIIHVPRFKQYYEIITFTVGQTEQHSQNKHIRATMDGPRMQPKKQQQKKIKSSKSFKDSEMHVVLQERAVLHSYTHFQHGQSSSPSLLHAKSRDWLASMEHGPFLMIVCD